MAERRSRRSHCDGCHRASVNRRGFLARSGADGHRRIRWPRVAPGGTSTAAARRPRPRAPLRPHRPRPPSPRPPRFDDREQNCSCTTGRRTSTPRTWTSSRPTSASRRSPTTRTPTTRSCWPSSRPARRATTSRPRPRNSCQAMAEEGFLQKLDLSRIPNLAIHRPDVQGPVVGPDRRVPGSQGLRHHRRSCT